MQQQKPQRQLQQFELHLPYSLAYQIFTCRNPISIEEDQEQNHNLPTFGFQLLLLGFRNSGRDLLPEQAPDSFFQPQLLWALLLSSNKSRSTKR